MTHKKNVWLFLSVIFLTGCSSDRKTPDSLPFIDIRKNYPEKEIVLTDIADITYVHLSTQNDDFLYKGGINFATENTFVVTDQSSNSFLFFSRDGNPKSRFNRYGQGPEEYYRPEFTNVVYDEATDELFVPMSLMSGCYMQIYSSTGEYKRKLTLPQSMKFCMGSIFVPFDDQSLLVYNDDILRDKRVRKRAGDHSAFSPRLNDSAFVLVSRIDGKVLEYVEMPSITTDLSVTFGSGGYQFPGSFARIAKCAEGFILCNPENDTIYLYKKDKSLTPILHKIPLYSESSRFLLNGCLDVGRHQFMSVRQLLNDERMSQLRTYFVRDKETGEIFRQKIILPDYRGKELFIHAYSTFTRYFENEYQFTLSLSELKQAEKENRLSGKLKELVATLNADTDNDVFMFVKFK